MGLVNRFPDRGKCYGMLAFAGTGLGAFSTYAYASRIDGPLWQLIATFITGAAFIAIGVFSSAFVDNQSTRRAVAYAATLTLLGVAAVFLSPIRGFFGIILLPLASQLVFIFPWRISLPWGAGLYLASCSIFIGPYGIKGFTEALISYSPAYLFTIIFSFVTKDALTSREHALQLKNELETANARLRAQADQTAELATTRERNRLAREIHDGVGHYLTVINVQLEAARAVLGSDPTKAANAVNTAARLSREALEDVRRSVGSLRDGGPRPALVDSVQELSKVAGLPVVVTIIGESSPLPTAIEHALFRAVQEGLTNMRKHAQATRGEVVLNFSTPNRIRLQISDNGRGISPDSTNAEAGVVGFGLRGMHERVELLGGSVDSGNRPSGGFQLLIEVPV